MKLKLKNTKKHKVKLKAFYDAPQKGGTCIKVFVGTPKKPNSALRKLTKVFLTTKKNIIAHIPGEGHSYKNFLMFYVVVVELEIHRVLNIELLEE